jgi:hypothetical protein
MELLTKTFGKAISTVKACFVGDLGDGEIRLFQQSLCHRQPQVEPELMNGCFEYFFKAYP